MTLIQKQRIAELRGKGTTYAAIALELGISENTVKSYCRRNKVEFAANACPECGNALLHTPHKKQKRFCSDKCRLAWWAKNPQEMKRRAVYDFVCPRCKNPFTAYGNAKRKFCSVSCARRVSDG